METSSECSDYSDCSEYSAETGKIGLDDLIADEHNSVNTNRFYICDDKYKSSKKYKYFENSRVKGDKMLLCCSDVKQNVYNYFVIDENNINAGLENHKIFYEVIYGFSFIKPYIDLDMKDEFDDDEVIKTFDKIIKKLDHKLSYVFGGYTSIKSINDKFKYIELKDVEKTHKKLSLRIFAYKYAIDINKTLAFWIEYIGLNKELINKKIIDPTVYKAMDKQQKLRLLQSNKTKDDNKGVNHYYVYDKDRKQREVKKGFKVEYLAATWTKDTELFDSSKLTDNKTLNKSLNGKPITQIQTTNNSTENNEDEITPLFDEDTLLKLLNLFPTDWDAIEKVVSTLCHSPYPIDVIKRVCYKWYNSINHINGDKTADFIDRYYEYTKNNKWFYSIINQYYTPQTIKDFGWSDEDDKIYNKLAFTTNDKLALKQRKQKSEIVDKYVECKEKLEESLTEDDKKKYETRKYFVNLFRDLKRIITPYKKDGSYYNRLFVDEKYNAYMLNKRNRLEQINRENFNEIIKNNNINKKDLTIIDGIEIYNYIRKFYDVFVQDKYNEKVQESLNIFKSGFVNEYDYMYYMRWLSMKLNNPYDVIEKNIVCVDGTSSFKSRFIGSFTEFIKVQNIDYSVDTANTFNEWVDSSIVVIDEVPSKAKECADFQNRIKRMTGSDYVKINRKFEHETTLKTSTNFIINSNYPECGGLFNNQKQNEMFRRFRIIKKQTIDKDAGNILCANLKDKHILYNLYMYIKNTFKPMTVKEVQEVSEYEKEYITKTKNTDDNKKVVPRYLISECIDSQNRLRLKKLVDYLKDNGCVTTIATEKSYLLFNDICKINGSRDLKIIDIEKFENIYLVEEDDDDKKEEIEDL